MPGYFSTGITQNNPTPSAISVSACPGLMSVGNTEHLWQGCVRHLFRKRSRRPLWCQTAKGQTELLQRPEGVFSLPSPTGSRPGGANGRPARNRELLFSFRRMGLFVVIELFLGHEVCSLPKDIIPFSIILDIRFCPDNLEM